MSKIKSNQDGMKAEDFSSTYNNLAIQLGDAEALAALVPTGENVFNAGDSAMKAAVETLPKAAGDLGSTGGTVYGFEVSAMLTIAVLACAIPRWWRKTSVG